MENNEKNVNRFFKNSLLLKIVSLLCAVLLWFYVSAVESPTSEKNINSVAVTLRNKDVMMSETGLSVISDGVFEVNVVLSGKKSTLNKIDYEDVKATVDLSKLTEAGTHELPVYVTPPAGTTLMSTNPRYITVSIDKTISKPFEIETDIYYSTTYDIGDSIITDTSSNAITSVTVSGPATEVDRIGKVVARIDFGSIRSSVEGKTNLVCYDINGEKITGASVKLSPNSVIIKQPLYMTKTLTLKGAQANNTFSDKQISFKISPSTITVKGDPKILEELNSITLDPINERTLINDALTNTVNSLIKLPEGLEFEGMQNTATITVNVKNVNKQTFPITEENINVINKPDFLDIRFTDASFNLLLINAADILVPLDAIKLDLDLTSYTASGEYTVNIHPKFVEELPYAYFPHEAGYPISFELSKTEETKAGE